MYSLLEQIFVFATVHQDSLCTEHFRHFGQYACAALCNQEIGEHTQQRICRNTGETVGTAAFQTYTELGQRNIGTFVFGCFRIQIAQDFHSFLVFVAHFLSDHELHTVFIKLA